MHTLGATVLALIAVQTMMFLLGFVKQFVFSLMVGSIGAMLPSVMSIGLTACAYFGGLYFSLTLVPRSSTKIVTYVLIGFAVAGTVYAMVDVANQGAPIWVLIVQLVTWAAAVGGLWIARMMVEGERRQSMQRTAEA